MIVPSRLNARPLETMALVSGNSVHVRSVSSRYSRPSALPRGSYIVPA